MPDRALSAPPALAAHIAALEAEIAAQRGWSDGAAQVSAALAEIVRQQTSAELGTTAEGPTGAAPAVA